MPLYTFRVLSSEGKAEMELGFCRDELALLYAERMRSAAEIEVWRGSEHLRTLSLVTELADA
jgi:hypothetical protein